MRNFKWNLYEKSKNKPLSWEIKNKPLWEIKKKAFKRNQKRPSRPRRPVHSKRPVCSKPLREIKNARVALDTPTLKTPGMRNKKKAFKRNQKTPDVTPGTLETPGMLKMPGLLKTPETSETPNMLETPRTHRNLYKRNQKRPSRPWRPVNSKRPVCSKPLREIKITPESTLTPSTLETPDTLETPVVGTRNARYAQYRPESLHIFYALFKIVKHPKC